MRRVLQQAVVHMHQYARNYTRLQDVLVVEASDYVGGRIRELHGFSSWPIQLGPEFIHGKDNSMLMDELTAMGAKFTELGWPAHMWFPGQSKVLSADELEKDEVRPLAHVTGTAAIAQPMRRRRAHLWRSIAVDEW